ncbi:DUF305 domain-containing protein [Amycolatopsis balhimycina DSM 5908]|uniref:DUF305 domain-containing protein n=1 Tax=Amycolatopsis balhimycina DSM 5908 TaxID=1081091 RepID=A0A428WQ97_AMYBA|nr:DUF305 domain-containing protein [Amycolatopsis balhimycina]RSM45262.1 DUF305 domain-containing protein [Amycolatopsis balhimycina DSM 5908]
MRKNVIIGGIVLASTVLLGACGGTDSMSGMNPGSSAPSSAQAAAGHNADDVTFAQQMIPHHSQALDMAKLVPSRSTNPKVLDLASRIEKAQDPEIRQMRDWLTAWGAGASEMPGMTHESMPGMSGMMSGDDLKKLEAAKGTEFDGMWLGMMIEHHQGAVDMAKAELAKGGNADAKALAQKIIDAQQAEITEMRGLLTRS